MYAILLKEPFNKTPAEIRKLTGRQIMCLYFRPEWKDEEEISEPQTEDDIRTWCAQVQANFRFPEEKYKIWVEKSVAAWRKETGKE